MDRPLIEKTRHELPTDTDAQERLKKDLVMQLGEWYGQTQVRIHETDLSDYFQTLTTLHIGLPYENCGPGITNYVSDLLTHKFIRTESWLGDGRNLIIGQLTSPEKVRKLKEGQKAKKETNYQEGQKAKAGVTKADFADWHMYKGGFLRGFTNLRNRGHGVGIVYHEKLGKKLYEEASAEAKTSIGYVTYEALSKNCEDVMEGLWHITNTHIAPSMMYPGYKVLTNLLLDAKLAGDEELVENLRTKLFAKPLYEE